MIFSINPAAFAAEGLNALLGTNAVTEQGIMTLSAKANAATGVAS